MTRLETNIRPIDTLLISTFSMKHGAAAGESLGSESIAGHLLGEKGDEVSVDHVDLQLDPDITALKSRIAQKKPDILGVSVKIGALDQLDNLMQDIDVPMVVMGGALPTFAGAKLLERYPSAIMVYGEGELAITGLVGVIRGGVDKDKVPGIMYLDHGNLVSTQRIRPDLSKRHLPARITTQRVVDELNGLVWAEASRGCNGNCSFCSVRELHNGGFDGDISVDSVIEDLQRLRAIGVDLVSYTDDDFCGDIDRSVELAERIRKEVPGIKYTVSTRADHFWAEKLPRHLVGKESLEGYNTRLRSMTKKLAQSGLVRVFMGLESGSPSQLKRYGKGISVESNYRAIEILREEGIDVVAGYIPIDHLMNLQELKENLHFLRQTGMYLKVSNPLSVLRVQAGSPYLRMLDNTGLLGEQTEDLVFYKAQFQNPNVEQIAELADKWVTDLYAFVFGLKNEAARAVDGVVDDDSILAKSMISQLRELEMGFIESLTDYRMANLMRNNGLQAVIDPFLIRRAQIVKQVEEAISSGRFQHSNSRLKESVKQILQ